MFIPSLSQEPPRLLWRFNVHCTFNGAMRYFMIKHKRLITKKPNDIS